jgi:predicted nucleic acid-binding protein
LSIHSARPRFFRLDFSQWDAIHLGSALALKVDSFVSADARQCAAAKQAGLRVIQA